MYIYVYIYFYEKLEGCMYSISPIYMKRIQI